MKTKVLTLTIGAIAALVASAPQANAVPTSQLLLVSGVTTRNGTPVGANSENFIGSVGSWNIAVNASGSTLDASSSAPTMDLDLNAAQATAPAAPLDIYWSTEGFGIPTPEAVISELDGIGQHLGATVSFKTYYGSGLNNGYNGYTGLLGGPLSAPGSVVGGLIPGSATTPYSVTLEIILTPTGGKAKVTSVDGGLSFVPDGGMTLSLLGLGLAGLAGLRARLGGKSA